MIKRYKSNYLRRKASIRDKIKASSNLPRLTVFRSNTAIYAQVIDDKKGTTLAASKGPKKLSGAKETGESLAKKCLAKGVKSVVFDRGPYKYHGLVKTLAQSARETGLQF